MGVKRMTDPEAFLRALFDRAVAVADPMRSLSLHLPARPAGRVVVVGAGKASARMAEAVEAAWGPCEGLVITRYGYGRACRGVEIVEAAHPVPDAAGMVATGRMMALLAGLTYRRTSICSCGFMTNTRNCMCALLVSGVHRKDHR